jgi:hypothetical protein
VIALKELPWQLFVLLFYYYYQKSIILSCCFVDLGSGHSDNPRESIVKVTEENKLDET